MQVVQDDNPPKDIKVPSDARWLNILAIVKCNLSTDVLLIKTILNDTKISYAVVSLLSDDRALITFASKEDLKHFFGS